VLNPVLACITAGGLLSVQATKPAKILWPSAKTAFAGTSGDDAAQTLVLTGLSLQIL
jgi:hypothetical protein